VRDSDVVFGVLTHTMRENVARGGDAAMLDESTDKVGILLAIAMRACCLL
jgi:hypothetical protein